MTASGGRAGWQAGPTHLEQSWTERAEGHTLKGSKGIPIPVWIRPQRQSLACAERGQWPAKEEARGER